MANIMDLSHKNSSPPKGPVVTNFGENCQKLFPGSVLAAEIGPGGTALAASSQGLANGVSPDPQLFATQYNVKIIKRYMWRHRYHGQQLEDRLAVIISYLFIYYQGRIAM